MNTQNQNPDEVNESRNDTATYGDDTIGENTGDSALELQAQKDEGLKTRQRASRG